MSRLFWETVRGLPAISFVIFIWIDNAMRWEWEYKPLAWLAIVMPTIVWLYIRKSHSEAYEAYMAEYYPDEDYDYDDDEVVANEIQIFEDMDSAFQDEDWTEE